MLHYYFRTKENLFDKVFDKKIRLLNESLFVPIENKMSFINKVKMTVEAHYDFLISNFKLPFFILNEIMVYPERKKRFVELFAPKFIRIIGLLEKDMKEQIKLGNIINISPVDLLLNIGCLNAGSVIVSQLIYEGLESQPDEKENFIKQRKKENVDFIVRSLRP